LYAEHSLGINSEMEKSAFTSLYRWDIFTPKIIKVNKNLTKS